MTLLVVERRYVSLTHPYYKICPYHSMKTRLKRLSVVKEDAVPIDQQKQVGQVAFDRFTICCDFLKMWYLLCFSHPK